MNYLAHLYFADPTPESRSGSLMGDFYRGAIDSTLPQAVQQGIRLHRQIDVFTDAHPHVVAARQRFEPPYRRVAGIVLDLAFDHFLCRHWKRFHAKPLATFLAEVYGDLAAYQGYLPPRMQQPLDRLLSQRWLAAYAELEGLDRAFVRMDQRFKKPTALAKAGVIVRRDYQLIEADFLNFFPELVAYVRKANAADARGIEGL